MTIDTVRKTLAWCTVINNVILIIWFAVFVLGHDSLMALHTRWFKLTPEAFDGGNYLGLAIYKIGVLLFNLTPYLALRLFVRG